MEKTRIDCVNGNYSMNILRFQGIPLAILPRDQYLVALLKQPEAFKPLARSWNRPEEGRTIYL